MNRSYSSRFSTLPLITGFAALTLCAACQPAPAPDPDAAATGDASGGDAGDAGTPHDAGVPTGDTGVPTGDTGVPTGDAGGPSGDASVQAFAVGGDRAFVLLSDSTVWTWGDNDHGQLGDGTTTNRTTPTALTTLSGPAAQFAAGETHSCAVLSSGEVQCWGDNTTYQLGDGTNVEHHLPTTVSLPGPAAQVATGWYHTCALLRNGTVQCWGSNANGVIRTPADGDGHPPTAVTGFSGTVTQLAVGGEGHVCALIADGTVQCWGWNNNGQLGNGAITGGTSGPTTVTGLRGAATQITAGSDSTCALLADGTVQCWGWNEWGTIGDGTTTNRPSATDLMGLSGHVVQVSVHNTHGCVRLADGTAQCWGYNARGALGDGTLTSRLTPVAVTGLGGSIVDLATGDQHSCARLDGSTVRIQCWGRNHNGQLGDGTTTDQPTPTTVVW